MSPHDDEKLSPSEQRARDAVRALPHASAGAAFRARLGAEFAAGSIADGRFSALPAAASLLDELADEVAPHAGDEDARRASARDALLRSGTTPLTHAPERLPGADVPPSAGAPRATVLPMPARRPMMWRWASAAAAMAAAWLVASAMNRAPEWRVSDVQGVGMAIVDGRPIALNHADEIQQALRHGGRLVVAAGSLMLMAPGQLAIEVLPGTELQLPPAPQRLWDRHATALVESGEIRITTGRQFRGADLTVTTPEAKLDVVGTTLAVIREPAGTCVCVLDGRVMVGTKDGAMAAVEHMRRRMVFADGSGVEDAAIRDAEIGSLGRFRDEHRAAIDAAK